MKHVVVSFLLTKEPEILFKTEVFKTPPKKKTEHFCLAVTKGNNKGKRRHQPKKSIKLAVQNKEGKH